MGREEESDVFGDFSTCLCLVQVPLAVDEIYKYSGNSYFCKPLTKRRNRVNKEVCRNQIPWRGWAFQFLWHGDLSSCFPESGSWSTWSSLDAIVELFAVVMPITNLPASVTRISESQCRQKLNYFLTSETLFLIGWELDKWNKVSYVLTGVVSFTTIHCRLFQEEKLTLENTIFPLCFEHQMMINWVNCLFGGWHI